MQNLQIFLACSLRLLCQQPVIGQPEAARREQVVAVAVVGESARLAHQPVDDVPVLDPMFAATTQPRQTFHLFLGVPHFQMVGVQAHLDPFADQPARHRIRVAADVDRAAAIHTHRHALAGIEPLHRQRSQHGHFLVQPLDTPLVALPEQLADKRFVVRAAGEVSAATQQQRLIQGTLELAMALLNVAILVRSGRVDGLALQTVVPQQTLVTLLKSVPVTARRHGGGQRIGAMHLRHTAQFL
jgi:hypothetical protein